MPYKLGLYGLTCPPVSRYSVLSHGIQVRQSPKAFDGDVQTGRASEVPEIWISLARVGAWVGAPCTRPLIQLDTIGAPTVCLFCIPRTFSSHHASPHCDPACHRPRSPDCLRSSRSSNRHACHLCSRHAELVANLAQYHTTRRAGRISCCLLRLAGIRSIRTTMVKRR